MKFVKIDQKIQLMSCFYLHHCSVFVTFKLVVSGIYYENKTEFLLNAKCRSVLLDGLQFMGEQAQIALSQ